MSIFLTYSVGFFLLALSSKQIGDFFSRIKLPLISGFLFTGILIGPYALKLISADAVLKLRFIDEISLAVIALAAGSELFVKELRGHFKSITWITISLVILTFVATSFTVFIASDYIPFMRDMPVNARWAVAILAGAIMVARSPSSAIAIVTELRASGPFTQISLGVTIITDVVVIVLFSINSSVADGLLSNLNMNFNSLLILALDLFLSLILGFFLSKIAQWILSLNFHRYIKAVTIIGFGYSIFLLTSWLHHFTQSLWGWPISLEPLLICMIAGFVITNYTDYRDEFRYILHEVGPPVYIAFFTLTGASLALDILVKTWAIALALFFVRLLSIFIGGYLGGAIAGDPPEQNRRNWMTYITQAGVGLGLAKQVAVDFPDWGAAFATMIIAVIVLNQIIGPPFFKWGITLQGEAHPKAEANSSNEVVGHNAIIFGLAGRSLTLARQLKAHDWHVKITTQKGRYEDIQEATEEDGIILCPIEDLSLDTLKRIGLEYFDAVIMFLSDEENYQLAETIYENFGTKTIVTLLHDKKYYKKFKELDVLVVDPDTAIVNLFEHIVRSPLGTSILLGFDDEDKDIVDFEVKDPSLNQVTIRDLKLPFDAVVLSILHKGKKLVSHGYTRIEVGDIITVLGPPESLAKVELLLEGGPSRKLPTA